MIPDILRDILVLKELYRRTHFGLGLKRFLTPKSEDKISEKVDDQFDYVNIEPTRIYISQDVYTRIRMETDYGVLDIGKQTIVGLKYYIVDGKNHLHVCGD